MATPFVRYFSHGPSVDDAVPFGRHWLVDIPFVCRYRRHYRDVDNVEWTNNENFPRDSQRRPFLETVRHGFIASRKSP